jgi:hypothetical protein
MATFQIGDRQTVTTFSGKTVEVGEYALHVQCPWRFTRDLDIVVGSSDLYYPPQDEANESDERFDWRKGDSRRDRLLRELLADRSYVVQGVRLGVGGFCDFELSDGLCLQVFPDDSTKEEHWRVFAIGGDEAHVV